MHELSIAHEVVETAAAEAARHGASRVTAVVLRVGVLRGVEPENLRFLFPLAAQGTAVEGAALEIETDPVAWRCRVCSSAGEEGRLPLSCPRCGSPELDLSGGEELRVKAIDVD